MRNVRAFAFVLDDGDDDSRKRVGEKGELVMARHSQFIPVPDDGSYSPFGRISAFVAQIAQNHISPPPPFLERNLWVALGEFDAASVPLE